MCLFRPCQIELLHAILVNAPVLNTLQIDRVPSAYFIYSSFPWTRNHDPIAQVAFLLSVRTLNGKHSTSLYAKLPCGLLVYMQMADDIHGRNTLWLFVTLLSRRWVKLPEH